MSRSRSSRSGDVERSAHTVSNGDPALLLDEVTPVLASEAETADYIAELLRELERLAFGSRLVKLQFLLRQALEEARLQSVDAGNSTR